MKLLGYTFVFAFFGFIGHVVSNQEEKPFACYSHRECALTLGPNCFCLKQPRQHHGECLCKLDPDILKNECSFDSECKSVGYELCYCSREGDQPTGKCKCVQPLLG